MQPFTFFDDSPCSTIFMAASSPQYRAYETTPSRSMCSRTLPFIRKMACCSNSIWARLDRSTILICLDGLFSSPFYP